MKTVNRNAVGSPNFRQAVAPIPAAALLYRPGSSILLLKAD